MKENGGQAINQEKCDDIKAEAEQAKLEAKLAKEEVLRCKIEQEKEEVMQSKIEGVKEELLKCKINMAKAETEWYKKAAEECKNEKRIDTDKPIIKGGNESGEITSQEITPNHSEQENCGVYASYYQANNKIGHQGFNTSDLLRELYPEMYSNPRIAKHIEKGTDGHYGAVNFKFAFTGDIDSAASFSNMKCGQCVSNPQELSCQDDKIKSFCYYDVFFNNMECNKNLFSRESCPDLIRKSGGISVIKAKQVSPFILVNNSGQMIDKEGNNTQIQYNLLKPYLKANGKIKDCGNDQNCKDYNAIMKKVAWDTDKEVLLKTVFDDTQRASPYYEDNSVSDDTNVI